MLIRKSEKCNRSQLDLCVAVMRSREVTSERPICIGRLVEHSKRQVRGFVSSHKMLEPDVYVVVCLAFNHWHTGLFSFCYSINLFVVVQMYVV